MLGALRFAQPTNCYACRPVSLLFFSLAGLTVFTGWDGSRHAGAGRYPCWHVAIEQVSVTY
jgi:hypothetical protein